MKDYPQINPVWVLSELVLELVEHTRIFWPDFEIAWQGLFWAISAYLVALTAALWSLLWRSFHGAHSVRAAIVSVLGIREKSDDVPVGAL